MFKVVDANNHPVPCVLILSSPLIATLDEAIEQTDKLIFTPDDDGVLSGWVSWNSYNYFLACSDSKYYGGRMIATMIGMLAYNNQSFPSQYGHITLKLPDFQSKCADTSIWPTIKIRGEEIHFSC